MANTSGDWWLNTFQGAVSSTVSLLPAMTFAELPSPVGIAGTRAFLTDSPLTSFNSVITTGAGSNKVPVYSDGANWLVG
jgi:hypothetical protein